MWTGLLRQNRLLIGALALFVFAQSVNAQSSAFNYQGKLSIGGTPANATYEIQFRLFDAESGGAQIGATITDSSVVVVSGLFSTTLNFGQAAFEGSTRFLEISVRPAADVNPFTVLSPRQPINSAPYAIRSINSAQLGGVDASEYVTTSTVGNAFVINNTTPQTGDFNLSGDGTLGGTLQANEVRVQTAPGNYGMTHTDGTISLSSYVGSSGSGATGGWIGTQSNHPLHFFTNAGQSKMTIDTAGNVGIGTFNPQAKLDVAGNIVQDRDKGGTVKAMLYVNGNVDPLTLVRCYNGTTGASTGNCGFTVVRSAAGIYQITFGFQVSDRFISVTGQTDPPITIGGPTNVSANFRFTTSNTLVISTFYSGSADSTTDAAFMLIVQ